MMLLSDIISKATSLKTLLLAQTKFPNSEQLIEAIVANHRVNPLLKDVDLYGVQDGGAFSDAMKEKLDSLKTKGVSIAINED